MENGDSSSSSTEEVLDFDSDSSDDDAAVAASISHHLLRLSSPHFCPTLALNLSKQEALQHNLVPDPSAPTYLNLHHYDKAMAVAAAAAAKEKSELFPPPPPEKSAPSTSKIKRRFLPHQMPTFKPRVEAPDTLKVMETVTGPLSGLRTAMEEKRRVKVWTRRDTGLRGFLTGFIEAFDKHWNLALRDVDEVFCRKRGDKCKDTPNINGSHPVPPSRTHLNVSQSPIKKSRRIAAMSKKSKELKASGGGGDGEKGGVVLSGSPQDLLNYCRVQLEKVIIGEKENSRSKSHLRKHRIRWVKTRRKDDHGFVVVGVTDKLELVERHVSQLFVMGNDIVFVETNANIR